MTTSFNFWQQGKYELYKSMAKSSRFSMQGYEYLAMHRMLKEMNQS